jgi:hypothetical protein
MQETRKLVEAARCGRPCLGPAVKALDGNAIGTVLTEGRPVPICPVAYA